VKDTSDKFGEIALVEDFVVSISSYLMALYTISYLTVLSV